MFTVLVKRPDQSEDLYECDTVHKEPHALLMRGENLGDGDHIGLEILGPKGQTMAFDWDRNSVNVLTTESEQAQVYVMNSKGRTIATYYL